MPAFEQSVEGKSCQDTSKTGKWLRGQEVSPMSDEKPRTIADSERSPASEAADQVEIGPPGTNPDDEQRPEPGGTAEAVEPKTGPDGKPIVPPSRGTVH
jgi:hypothetical protein